MTPELLSWYRSPRARPLRRFDSKGRPLMSKAAAALSDARLIVQGARDRVARHNAAVAETRSRSD